MVQSNTTLLDLLIGLLLPLLVTLATKASASPAVKRAVLAVLSAAGAVLSVLSQYHGHLPWKTVALNLAVVFFSAIGAYFGVWKNSQTHTALDASTANVGIGSATPGYHEAGATMIEICVLVIAVVAVIALFVAAFGTGIHVSNH